MITINFIYYYHRQNVFCLWPLPLLQQVICIFSSFDQEFHYCGNVLCLALNLSVEASMEKTSPMPLHKSNQMRGNGYKIREQTQICLYKASGPRHIQKWAICAWDPQSEMSLPKVHLYLRPCRWWWWHNTFSDYSNAWCECLRIAKK